MKFTILLLLCIVAAMSQDCQTGNDCKKFNTCCAGKGRDFTCQSFGKEGDGCYGNYTDYRDSATYITYTEFCPCAGGYFCVPNSAGTRPYLTCTKNKDACISGSECTEENTCCAGSGQDHTCQPLGKIGDECYYNYTTYEENPSYTTYSTVCPCGKGLTCLVNEKHAEDRSLPVLTCQEE